MKNYIGGQKWPRECKKKIAIGGQIAIIGGHGLYGLDKIHGLRIWKICINNYSEFNEFFRQCFGYGLYLFSILHVGHVAHAGHVACMLTLLNLIVIFARYICQRPHWAPYFFFVHDLLPCLLCCQIFELMSLLVPFRHKITKISYFVFKYINWHYSRFRRMCFLGIFDKKKI